MATALVLQQELADRLNLDQTVAANATKLQRWLNLIQQDFCGRQNWKFLEEREAVAITIDYTTGTAEVTNASATVTGTGTVWVAAHVRSFIQFADNNDDWYEITARGSNTSITISPAFQGTTDTSTTYTIRKVFYPLSASAEDILDIRQYQSPRKLTCYGFRAVDRYRPNMAASGNPVGYYKYRLDPDVAATAAKAIQFVLEPAPSAAMILEVRIKKILADYAATDGNISQVPVRWHNIMLDGAEAMGRMHLNDPGYQNARDRYEEGVGRAMAEDRALGDRNVVIGSQQETQASRWLPFPSNYEQPL